MQEQGQQLQQQQRLQQEQLVVRHWTRNEVFDDKKKC